MRRSILTGIVLLLSLAAVPVFAQNCVSFQCYFPPPGDCAECGTYFYNGASSCDISYSGYGCILGGYCDTGMGDCTGSCSRTPQQQWARLKKSRALTEEWSLVRATVRPQGARHRQS